MMFKINPCRYLWCNSKDVKVRDVILAQGATSDTRMNQIIWGGAIDFAPIADFDLLLKHTMQVKMQVLTQVGNIFTADLFYSDEHQNEKLAQYGVLAVEMESAALYTLAAKFGRKALAVLTVSDHIITGEVTTAEERQTTFNDMIVVALDAAIQD